MRKRKIDGTRKMWISVTVVLVGVLFSFLGKFFLSDSKDARQTLVCDSSAQVGEVLWTYDIDGDIYGTAAIDGDRVYIGAMNGKTFYAFKNTGELLWKSETGMSVESSPAVGPDGTIYANTILKRESETADRRYLAERYGGFSVNELQGTIALSPDDGEVLWASHSVSGSDGSPAVTEDGERIYAGVVHNVKMRALDPDLDPPGKKFYAFDAKTGETIWEIDTKGWVFSSPAISPLDGTVYVGAADDTRSGTSYGGKGGAGEFFAISKDGKVKWKISSDSEFGASPAIFFEDGEEYVIARTQQGHIYKLDREGDVVWERDLKVSGLGSPVLGADNKLIYLTTGNGLHTPYGNQLLALWSHTGEIAWTHTLSEGGGSPAVGDKGVYVLSHAGEFIAFSEEGEEMWKVELGDTVVQGSVALNACGVAFVGTEHGTFTAIQTESDSLSKTSSWPKYRADERATGNPNY